MDELTKNCLAAQTRAIAAACLRIGNILDPIDPPIEDAAEPERQPGDTWCRAGEYSDATPESPACYKKHGNRRPGQSPKARGVPAIITKCKHCGELLTEPEEPAATPERPRPMLCVHHGGSFATEGSNEKHGFVCPTCYGKGTEPPEPANPAEELPPLWERVEEYLDKMAVYYPGFTAQERSTLVDAIRELEARPPRDATCGGCKKRTTGECLSPFGGYFVRETVACVKIQRETE